MIFLNSINSWNLLFTILVILPNIIWSQKKRDAENLISETKHNMETLKPPKPLILEGNLAERWRSWKQDFTLFMEATESTEKSDKTKCSILLHCIGNTVREIYNTFTFTTAEEAGDRYELLFTTFENYFSPKKNLTFLRFQFLTARQNESETFDEFCTRLRKLSTDCDFTTLKDSLIKDLIIIGIRDKKLQQNLLKDPDITLETVIKNGRAHEASKIHARALQTHSSGSINELSKNNNNHELMAADIIKSCKFCSYSHPRGSCPAYNKTCRSCNRRGHFSKCCSKRSTESKKYSNKSSYPGGSSSRVYELNQIEDSSCSNDTKNSEYDGHYFLGTINAKLLNTVTNGDEVDLNNVSRNLTPNEWFVELESNGTNVNYKIDSGAQANVLPYPEFCTLIEKPCLESCNTLLTAYNGTPITVKGQCTITLYNKGIYVPVSFIVTDTEATPVLGLQTSINLNLIKRIHDIHSVPNYVKDYADCFGELGTLPKKYKIIVDPTVPPVINAPRRIPIALKEKLQVELQRMVDLKIICPVSEPTDWVNSLVVVEKPNGTLRICIDPKNLNRAIKRHHHQLPTTEEILSMMSDGKYFTKLDASNAYWQIELDADSTNLLTFNTPYGRYKFLRMPFGIHSASEICQVAIAEILEGIEGSVNCQDDIIIWGSSEEILKTRTIKVLNSIRKNGLKLNKNKCKFHVTDFTFLGHKISNNGIHPDPAKIEAIKNMPLPTTRKELQRFLGMVNYLGKFIPNLSDHTAPLRILLEKDTLWVFDTPQIEAVTKLKHLICSSPVLKFYDSRLPIQISCDASLSGLGAVLEQKFDHDWHPIAFSSRSLSSSERNYCQLEKEMLSIVFACEHFHEYIYGMQFNVFNDHLPLQSIFQKSITKAPARLQRFLLRLQKYSFTMHYIKGSRLVVADTLSRASLPISDPEIPDADLHLNVHTFLTSLPISNARFIEFQTETNKDDCLQFLVKQIQEGWPSIKNDVNPAIRHYFHIRDELTTLEGIILKGRRIVVPKSMRTDMMKRLHTGHLGIIKTISMARETLYWPGIISDINDLVSSCGTCQEYRNKQSSEPLIYHEIPDVPWTKIGTDLFHVAGKHFLILVDYTSNYFDISELPNCESSTIVQHTKCILNRYGIPKLIFSDNGPEFTARPYTQFTTSWDIEHNTSSPEFPRSNGHVERMIQTVKKTLKKALHSENDPHLALLTLKTTPLVNGKSPADIFFNRKLRTIIPSMNDIVDNNDSIKCRTPLSSGHTLPPINVGDSVRLRQDGRWSKKGIVAGKRSEPRSYNILTRNGNILRRNRQHLLRTRETFDHSEGSDSPLEFDDTLNNLPIQINEPDITIPINSSDQPAVLNNELPEPRVTRSGRQIRTPAWLSNYVTDP